MLPPSTDVLIVGAGPAGLTCAITLITKGWKPENITIIDAQAEGVNLSRAIVIHAQTLEELEYIDCMKPIVARGIHANYMTVRAQQRKLVRANFASLAGRTKHPYALLISQSDTERVLEKRLEELGGAVLRPYKMADMEKMDDGVKVTLESGETIKARYVVGADGARSMVRKIAGIEFRDPTTMKNPFNEPQDQRPGESWKEMNERLGLSLVIADVHLAGNIPKCISPTDLNTFLGPLGFLLLVPLPPNPDDPEKKIVYRMSCPSEAGSKEVTLERLQKVLNAATGLKNRTPVVENIIWSSRFRVRSAVADQFFNTFGGGVVALVGDAAHVHSPAGGQGMNLGIRDAIALGTLMRDVLENDKLTTPTAAAKQAYAVAKLQTYSNQRREFATTVIKMTKVMTWLTGMEGKSARTVRNTVWWFFGKPQAVNDKFALKLSGLKLKA